MEQVPFTVGFITLFPTAIQEMGQQDQSCLAECGQGFRGWGKPSHRVLGLKWQSENQSPVSKAPVLLLSFTK